MTLTSNACRHSSILSCSNRVPFALDTLPECLDKENNNDQAHAQKVELPIIVNGRIPHVMQPNEFNRFYLETKAAKSGHMIDFHGKEHLPEQSDPAIVAGMSESQIGALNE